MRVRKIAYILTPVTFGGSEKVSLNFLRNVDHNIYNIHPIILIRDWEEATIFEKDLINQNYSYSRISLEKTNSLISIWRCFKNIRSAVKSESIDLVHTHGYLADILGWLVAKSLGIPIVSTCHGFIFKDLKLRFYYKLDLLVLKYFNGIIAVSANINALLVANHIKQSIIEVITNAVDNNGAKQCEDQIGNTFRHGKDDLVLGFVGRLSAEKGVKYLIEALAILRSKNVSAKLLIIGEGPDFDELLNLTKEKNIENEVLFLGFQNNIYSFLKNMDIFVLPSLTEGTPLALLEAMSAKVPVVATRVGGVPDIIDNCVNGMLVNPRSQIELAEAVIRLHSDNTLKQLITNNASALIEKKYSMTAWMSKLYNVYNQILQNCD